MILRMMSEYLKDLLVRPVEMKYHLESIYDTSTGTKVKCITINEGETKIFDLEDIILLDKLQSFASQDIMKLTAAFEQKRGKINKYDQRFVRYYTICSMWFVACYILSNLGALKLCDFWGLFQLDAGTFIFPLLYVINDVVTEVYGFMASRRMIIIALMANCIVVSVLYVITLLPHAGDNAVQQSMNVLFTISPKIFIASIFSYFIGELLNSKILVHMKEKYKGRNFALRAVVSTSISAFLESSIFCIIAFTTVISAIELIKMILVLTLVKVVYEIMMLPITVRLVEYLKLRQKIDYIDLSGHQQTFKVV